MKLKSILVIGLGLAMSISASAQTDGNDYWFTGLGGGVNLSLDGLKFENRPLSHFGAGTSLDMYVGKWINEFAGFRIGYQGLSTSNTYDDYGKYRFDYLHGDLLFNVADWFIPYVHGGILNIDKSGAAGGVGFMTPIRITKRVAIVPDVKALAYTNRLIEEAHGKFGVSLTGTLGLAINLGSKRAPVQPAVTEPVVVPGPTVRYQTDTVIIERVKVIVDTVVVKDAIDDINEILGGIVLFDFDSYQLTDEAIPVLDQVADILKQHPDTAVWVEGHTDNWGSDAYNQKLSENRANSVKNYLVSKGIKAENLWPVGYGESRPITDNSTDELRHRNRRIEFRLK